MRVMIILASSCLIGKKCAYDGKARTNLKVLKLCSSSYVKCFDICPELIAGLPCPREKNEIQGGTGREVLEGKAIVISESGQHNTKYFISGAKKVLNMAIKSGISIALMKSNSPSCSNKKIYSGNFDNTLINGAGVTASLLMKSGIKVLSENEIDEVFELLKKS